MKIKLSNLKRIISEELKRIIEQKDRECPPATQDLEINTRNRNSAIKAEYIQYGPLNLADEEYWVRAAEHWNTEPAAAKASRCSNCVTWGW